MNQQEDATSIAASDNEEDDPVLAQTQSPQSPTVKRHELKWIRNLRAAVVLAVLVIAVFASMLVFRIARCYEDDIFRNNVAAFAEIVVEAVKIGVERRLATLNSFGITVTLYTNAFNASWPFVTVPAFELQSSAAKILTGSQMLALLPIVNDTSRYEWENYSVANLGWRRDEDWNQLQILNESSLNSESPSPSTYIYHFGGDGSAANDTGPGPYLPIWQSSLGLLSNSINLNLLSDPTCNASASFMIESREAVISAMIEPSASVDIFPFKSPYSLIFYPLFDRLGQDSQPVAALTMEIIWEEMFTNILPAHASGVVIVVENTVGQAFTYLVTGPNVTILGAGNLHELEFDNLEESYRLELLLPESGSNRINLSTTFNTYHIHVYPSRGLQERFKSNRPIILTVILNLALFFSLMVFILYNHLVERWRSKLLQNAMRSTEIVSSLFPSTVRDRLLNNDRTTPQPDVMLGRKRFPTSSELVSGNVPNGYLDTGDTPKNKLQSFLSNVPAFNYDSDEELQDNRPIADLFPNTTVMFADICGFTAWSSAREPSQVFMLLESLYRAFDKLALKRRVFKVETIGDCYMAVTGLPEPQEDHAVILARFAHDCIVKMKEVTRKLEITLGPETGDLALRIGLHSGPVTAGVLRGEKSRFQLFGDTVNTASRMESTGIRDTVQVSAETAALLFAAGKSHWIKQREDAVYAKGKGELTTFLLTLKSDTYGGVTPSTVKQISPLNESVSDGVELTQQLAAESLNTTPCWRKPLELSCIESQMWGFASLEVCRGQGCKHERLIDWNVEILLRLLKSLVSKRRLASRRLNTQNFFSATDEYEAEASGSLLDEVTEVIELPQFDSSVSCGDFIDLEQVELSSQVAVQLRSYVAFIASLYKDVPFHNFEHASHVAMSANKLIQRIMEPDGILCTREFKTKKKRRESFAKDRHDFTFGISSDPLTQFAVVFSALIHDVDHPGVSNFQLVKENAPMVKIYHGKSVLEQNSIDISWGKLMQPQFKELRKCIYTTEDEAKRFRQVIVNCVMATDIFDKEMQNLRRQRWSKAFQVTARSLPLSLSEDTNRKATIIMEHIIQASDVAHTMQHWHLYQKWNERLFQEMHLAYRQGRGGKDPAIGWYQGELGFFDNYVIPLANKLKDCGVFGASGDEYLNYAIENRREWAVKGENIVRQFAAKQENDSIT